MTRRRTRRRGSVLFGSREPASSENPFLTLLAQAISGTVDTRFFSWRVALFGRYDLLHVHWPELLFRDTAPGLRGIVRRSTKRLLFLALVARKRLTRTPWVWTVHNVQPHELASPIERLLLGLFHHQLERAILLNDEEELEISPPTQVIPHPAYVVPVERENRVEDDDVILFFGLVRPYKGIESLIDAFGLAGLGSDWRLVVTGDAVDEDYARSLKTKLDVTPFAAGTFRPLPEDELHDRIAGSRLVALPYRNMYNSGALLLAVGHGRHVLAPSTKTTRALRDEIGEQWMTLFDPPLSPADLEDAAEASRLVEGRPDLSHRSWARAGSAHLEAYEAALRSARSR